MASTSQTAHEPASSDPTLAHPHSDRLARWLVWSVWLVMVLGLLIGMARWSSPVPLAEDWLLVSPLAGHEPDLAEWAWAQNNEHRSPISRLVLLALLKAANGDFRVGGYFNIAILAAACAMTIVAVRKLRGRSDLADVFFPLTLLHFGHSGQFLFGWQLTFVLPVAILVVVMCVLFSRQSVVVRGGAVIVGLGLVLLPLTGGGNGLLYIPGIGVFLIYAGWSSWSQRLGSPPRRFVAAWLFSSVTFAVMISTFYFVNYHQPTWNPPSPGVIPSAKTALKVLSLGFGPVAEKGWELFAMATLVLIASTVWCALRACIQQRGFARQRAVGGTFFLINAIGAACLVGWVRAGYVPEFGIPTRYVLLVSPAFCGCFFAWEMFGPIAIGRVVQRCLAGLMLVLLPFNTRSGYTMFASWYSDGMKAFRADLAHGLPFDELAANHGSFLIHWWKPAELAPQMQWLRDAGVEEFSRPEGRAQPPIEKGPNP